MVALNDDLALLGRAAHAAAGLEQARQVGQIGPAAHEAPHERHDLARPLPAVEPHAQLLPRRRERLGLGPLVGPVFEIGIGRIDRT